MTNPVLSTRRGFLAQGLRLGVTAPLISSMGWASGAGACPADGARALVVLQLTGGNDGLNTLVPHRQDAYHRLRPSLGLARDALLPLDDDHGLHPSMEPLRSAVEAGRLAAVHGVGCPEPDRSHFRSMEIWHTADPDHPPGETGWMGRMADQLAARAPGTLAALCIGDGDLPLSLRARDTFAPSVVDPDSFRLAERTRPIADQRARLLELDGGSDDLAFLRRAAATSYEAAKRVTALAGKEGRVEYPANALGRKLRLIGRLLAGGFEARMFHVELGGFDTHARQARLHAGLLDQLAQALAAFDADLAEHGLTDSVTTLVFSEFGRRAAENGSKGTDHGAGAPVFLLGGRVRGGVHGTPPDLERLVDGDVPPTTDLRSLYATLERDWMGLEASSRLAPLDVLRT